jgi:hypothetical protein
VLAKPPVEVARVVVVASRHRKASHQSESNASRVI